MINRRSIAHRLVFADVEAFAIQQLCNGESGEGSMAEVEFARIAQSRAGDGALDLPARRQGTVLTNIGRPPYNPWGTVKGARAVAPSPARPLGRRGLTQGRGARPSFSYPRPSRRTCRCSSIQIQVQRGARVVPSDSLEER